MKKFINYVVIFTMLIATLFCVKMPVYAAGNVSVSASSTSVNVGDTVTITISVSSGYGVQGALSRSSGIFGGTSDNPYTVGDVAGQSNSKSFSFTATQEGSCTFSASVVESYDGELNPAGIGGGAVTVTVNNSSSGSAGGTSAGNGSNAGTGNSGNEQTTKSSDSSLKSLVISSGELSPKFSSDTKNYTATVDYNVTSIAVSATPNNGNAKVSSVSGNDSLEVGENTIKVVVKAENGVSSTYTITVTRREEEDPENTEDENKEMPSFSVGGEKRVITTTIPEEAIPEDFVANTIMIKGSEYPGVSFKKGSLQMIYLTQEDGQGGAFYVYDQNQDAVYPFVKLTCDSHYVILLLPDVNNVPENYIESTLAIEGKGIFTAYQTPEMLVTPASGEGSSQEDPESPSNSEGEGVGILDFFAPETIYAQETQASEFYLVYCMNDKGETGWYTYDSVEETFMRYYEMPQTAAPVIIETNNDKNPANVLLYIIMGIMGLVIAVLIIAVLFLSKKVKENPSDQDEEFDEETNEESNKESGENLKSGLRENEQAPDKNEEENEDLEEGLMIPISFQMTEDSEEQEDSEDQEEPEEQEELENQEEPDGDPKEVEVSEKIEDFDETENSVQEVTDSSISAETEAIMDLEEALIAVVENEKIEQTQENDLYDSNLLKKLEQEPIVANDDDDNDDDDGSLEIIEL